MIDKIRVEIFSFLLGCLYRLLSFTWRKTSDPMPPALAEAIQSGRSYVAAHFHEDEWSLISFYIEVRPNVMVSHSKDGAIMARFLERLGFHIARGSSSRGAVGGFLALLRLIKKSKDPEKLVTLAVDGPRGPRRKAKFGIFKLAEVLNGEILSVSIAADRAWHFKRSWSNAFLPKPFARVHRSFLIALDREEIKKSVERDDLAELAYKLEKSLIDAKSLAQNSVSTKPSTS
jgi:lysophospholipid acyltransferase (LPLAT)-like uncharacterized protein